VLFQSAFRTLRIVVCVGLQAAPALAVDLSVKSSLNESFEVNDNYFLVSTPKGTTYSPLTSVFLDVLARTPTTRYELNGDLGYTRYLGPGAEDTSLTTVKQDDLNFNFEHTGHAGDKVGLSAWWRQQDLATAQLNDIGVVAARGEMNSHGIVGNVYRQLNAIDSLAFFATGTSVNFTSSTAVPYVNLTTGVTGKHGLNPSTEMFVSADLNWTVQQDQAGLDTKLWRALTGVKVQPTPRLSLFGSVGVGVVTTGQDGLAGIVGVPLSSAPGAIATHLGTSVGLLAEAQVAYKLRSTTELSWTAARSITPDVLGNLSQRTSYGIGLTHVINSVSSLSFAGSRTGVAASGEFGASTFWTANVSYARRLTKEWRTQLTYNYRRRDDDRGSASSNALVLVLARDMTLLP
jgi:hypothetical protein